MMTPTLWLLLGVILIVAEVAAPAMVSLFFGLAALLVALLTWLLPVHAGLQWLLFALLSVALLLTLRSRFRSLFPVKASRAEGDPDRDIVGKQAVVTQRIEPGRPGKVELRGGGWPAEAAEILEPGTPVRVVRKESITLTVERL
jgi:membrane protein implicated in regulation of membrane protease activity